MSVAKYTGPDVMVTFEDYGQDFLQWCIEDGVVVDCWPFQSSIWCGVEVLGVPLLGEYLAFKHPGDAPGVSRTIKYPSIKVVSLRYGRAKRAKLLKAAAAA